VTIVSFKLLKGNYRRSASGKHMENYFMLPVMQMLWRNARRKSRIA
jgi:hypothetical protein